MFWKNSEKKKYTVMKIIIPVVDSNNATRSIANSFHNTKLACIYDSAKGSFEWIATKNMITSGSLDTVLKKNEISVVITRNMPLMALGFFTESGVKVFQAESEDILENIELFNRNGLLRMTNASGKMNSLCSGSCGSCNTACKS